MAPSFCPRCRQRPPRLFYGARAKQPSLCQLCVEDARREHWRTYNRKRQALKDIARIGAVVPRVHDDIPAAEIERRFQHALLTIRRQRWTAHS